MLFSTILLAAQIATTAPTTQAALHATTQATTHATTQPHHAPTTKPAAVYYGPAASSISSGVIVPAGHATLYTSGTVPPTLDRNAPAGDIYARFGDTKTQAQGILKSIEAQLKENGLTMADVAYLRVYVVADPKKEGKPDFKGWFDAYAEVFGTESNPTKPARSTLAVASLVNPDWLIEIEAVAVYPAK